MPAAAKAKTTRIKVLSGYFELQFRDTILKA